MSTNARLQRLTRQLADCVERGAWDEACDAEQRLREGLQRWLKNEVAMPMDSSTNQFLKDLLAADTELLDRVRDQRRKLHRQAYGATRAANAVRSYLDTAANTT